MIVSQTMIRAGLTALFLCAAAAFGGLAWGAATTPYTLSGPGYVDLGVGPLRAQVRGDTAEFVVSDTPPAPTVSGEIYSYQDQPRPFDTTSHVWARGFNGPSTTSFVVVSPVSTAAPGGGSSAITAPIGGNTKAQSVSITLATDFLGQATMAGSLPVTIASNQSAIPVSNASLPLPTGAATDASLATIIGNQPASVTTNTTYIPGTTSGLLLMGNAGSGIQAYTTNRPSPVSLDPNGNLRVGLGVTALAGGVSAYDRVTGISPATTNAHLVGAAAAHRMFRFEGCNLGTSDVTFHFTNLGSAPQPGSTAVFDQYTAQASATAGKCQAFSMRFLDMGESFSLGLGLWVSTGIADTDATAPAAGAYSYSLGYQ